MSRSRSPSASAAAASQGGKSLWSEYKNAEGRVYWSHSITKQSVWEKPDELRTPFEKALSKTLWKQYVSKGRPYYVNSATKETKWDLPEELVKLKKKVEREEEYKAERDRRRREGLPSPTPPLRTPSPERSPSPSVQNAVALRAGVDPSSSVGQYRQEPERPSAPSRPALVWPVGGFLTHDKAEEAFIELLKHEGIDDSFTWEETMRKIIVHPFYKALETLAERKAAFEKYTRGLVAEKKAARAARIARVKPMIHRLFNQAELKSWMTMKTAEQLFKNDKYWREAEYDERREILEEWTGNRRAEEEAAERSLRERNIRVLTDLVKNLGLTISTRWRGAHDQIVSAPTFRDDPSLQKIETLDILNVWDEYSRQLEKEHDEESRRLRTETVRKARKAREGFRTLLAELQAKGELSGQSKWRETYRLIKDDERYLNMLGMPGSSAMDLWMDAVDDMAQETDAAADKVVRALNTIKKEVKIDTTKEEFEAWCKETEVDAQVDHRLRKAVFELLHGRLVKAAEDEVRRAERKRRHRIDDLRYALKKVSRHIDLEMSYEEAQPFMKDLPEYTDITEEEDRKAAFDKYIKRQKEKLREAEHSEHGSERGGPGDRDRDRRGDRGDRDRERERERERDRDRDRDRRYSSSATKDRYRDESSVDGTPRRDRHADSSAMDVDGPSSASKDRKNRADDRYESTDRDGGAGAGDRSRRRSSRYGDDGDGDDPERERRREKWASCDRRESAGRSNDRDHRDAAAGAGEAGSASRRDRRERTRYSASPEPEERESKRVKVSPAKKGDDVEEGEI